MNYFSLYNRFLPSDTGRCRILIVDTLFVLWWYGLQFLHIILWWWCWCQFQRWGFLRKRTCWLSSFQSDLLWNRPNVRTNPPHLGHTYAIRQGIKESWFRLWPLSDYRIETQRIRFPEIYKLIDILSIYVPFPGWKNNFEDVAVWMGRYYVVGCIDNRRS